MKKFNIIVDSQACIGCGGCAEIDSNVFEIDKNGKSILKIKPNCDNTTGIHNKVLDAAQSCPVNAITITEIN